MLDRDTNKVINQSQTIYDFVKSDGWRILKDKLVAQIIDLRDTSQIDKTGDERSIALSVLSNDKAAAILYGLLAEFEGTAQTHPSLMDVSRIQDDIILRQDGDSF